MQGLSDETHQPIFVLVSVGPREAGVAQAVRPLGQVPGGMVFVHQMPAEPFPVGEKASHV